MPSGLRASIEKNPSGAPVLEFVGFLVVRSESVPAATMKNTKVSPPFSVRSTPGVDGVDPYGKMTCARAKAAARYAGSFGDRPPIVPPASTRKNSSSLFEEACRNTILKWTTLGPLPWTVKVCTSLTATYSEQFRTAGSAGSPSSPQTGTRGSGSGGSAKVDAATDSTAAARAQTNQWRVMRFRGRRKQALAGTDRTGARNTPRSAHVISRQTALWPLALAVYCFLDASFCASEQAVPGLRANNFRTIDTLSSLVSPFVCRSFSQLASRSRRPMPNASGQGLSFS